MCERLIPVIRKASKDCGWGLGTHGSKVRDLDLICVRWVEESSSIEVLLKHIREAIADEFNGECYLGYKSDEVNKCNMKPHNRRAYTLFINSDQIVHSEAGAHPFIDLSIVDGRVDNN